MRKYEKAGGGEGCRRRTNLMATVVELRRLVPGTEVRKDDGAGRMRTFEDDAEGALADFLANSVVDTDDVVGAGGMGGHHGRRRRRSRTSEAGQPAQWRMEITPRSTPNGTTSNVHRNLSKNILRNIPALTFLRPKSISEAAPLPPRDRPISLPPAPRNQPTAAPSASTSTAPAFPETSQHSSSPSGHRHGSTRSSAGKSCFPSVSGSTRCILSLPRP